MQPSLDPRPIFASFLSDALACAPWWRRKGAPVVLTETTTMFALCLGVLGVGLICMMIYQLATYALPFFIGMTAGLGAFHAGAGVIGALSLGLIAGVLALIVGQVALASARSPALRAVVAALFVVPAAIAGHQVVSGLGQIGDLPYVWREVFACIGAIIVGATAWSRLMMRAEPAGSERV